MRAHARTHARTDTHDAAVREHKRIMISLLVCTLQVCVRACARADTEKGLSHGCEENRKRGELRRHTLKIVLECLF